MTITLDDQEIERAILNRIFTLSEDARQAQKQKTIRDSSDSYLKREERIRALEIAYQEECDRVSEYRKSLGLTDDCRNQSHWEICEDLCKPTIKIDGFYCSEYEDDMVFFLLKESEISTHRFSCHNTWTITIPELEFEKTITFNWTDNVYQDISRALSLDVPDGRYTIIFDCGRS